MQQNNLTSSYFPVSEVPAVGIPVKGKEIDGTGYKFIVREDTNDILSCVTNSYKLVTNKEIMQKASPVLKKQGAHLEEMRIFGNGARTKYKYRFPDTKVEIATGDFVNPEVIINNSYDGSTEISAMGGAFRLLCSNGMVIGLSLIHI